MTKMDKKSRHAETEINRIDGGIEVKMDKGSRHAETEINRIGRCAGVSPLSQSDPSPVLKYPHHLKNGPKSKQETGRSNRPTSLNCRFGAGFRFKNVF